MEAIGRLAGGIAHDFNNILGAIVGFAGFLVQDLPKGTPQHGFAKRIAMASERGKGVIQQILAFSRRTGVERKRGDLARIVLETEDLLRASLPSSTRLEVVVEADGLIADINAAQVSQILLNLCLNANDALGGQPGNVSIKVGGVNPGDAEYALFRASKTAGEPAVGPEDGRALIGALDANRAYAKMTVADTGNGMTPELLERVFEPFFTTKERGRGTGLGLAVVHGIVIANDGACIVTSRPGAGSTFAVYLPLAGGDAETATVEPAPPSLRGRERILVVDDDADARDALTVGLDRLGYEVVALDDPEEALAVFAEDQAAWDVVISDQVMPRMKGLTLFQRLKAIRPSLRFILCTGFGDGATEEMAAAAGTDAFFIKPVSAERLAASIRRLVDNPPGTEGGRRS
ncbi:MAG: response regulator [Proteobacteria bacterium]|nr:response regulator [Pseudomonadota bacterium]